MKTILAIFFFIILAPEIHSQVVKGKIVDENGDGLSSIDLQLYINPDIYNTTTLSDGNFIFNIVTSVEEGQIPSGYAVSNNFPNPFNPTTRIGITLPVRENVKIEVFNLLGQEVIRPIEQTYEAGINFIDIELNGMANGVYSARVTIGDKHIFVKKMMLVYGGRHLAISSGISNTEILKLNNTVLDTNIDSLVATSLIIGRKTFTDLPNVTGDTLDLGNLTIERYCSGIPTLEYAGKIYHTVQIGGRCWLKENLDIGMMIQGSDTSKDNDIIEKYCYDNDTSNCNTYGGLYQLDEAMQYTTTPSTRGICPDGWHIPTLAEFQTLSNTVDGDGNALKEIGQGTGSGEGTNTSGFSALLVGYRTGNGYFYDLSNLAFFWSSTEGYSTDGYYMDLYFNNSYIGLVPYGYQDWGLSVRCVKDSVITQNIPCPGTPTVEYEGKTYNTVQIGNQCWLNENLDVGVRINGIQNASDNDAIEKYCYNDDPVNCNTYGGLYQWNEAMQYTITPGTRGICPIGWHIPTVEEFRTLINTVGGNGNALKAIGQGTGDGAGTNTSGFSALLAGSREDVGSFYALSYYATFWSSTEYSWTVACLMGLYYGSGYVGLGYSSRTRVMGFSVRCLKDSVITQYIPCPGTPTVKYEGTTYNTVQIGSQCWQKENMDVGSMIPGVDTSKDNGIIEKYCYYNDTINCNIYGGLYQWNEAMQYTTTEGTQGICPPGWHIPTLAEFQTLSNTVDGDGNALKAIGQGIPPDGAGTDTSGFSALLAGYHHIDGYSFDLSYYAIFWSSTENNSSSAYDMSLSYYGGSINVSNYPIKDYGFSVRCIKD